MTNTKLGNPQGSIFTNQLSNSVKFEKKINIKGPKIEARMHANIFDIYNVLNTCFF